MSPRILLTLLVLAPVVVHAETYVFLLAGQSNMSGRGNVTHIPFSEDSRILSYNDGNYGTTPGLATATYWLRHDYGTTNTDGTLKTSAVGPGTFFASAILPTLEPDDSIVLVNRAWGGTSTAQWLPGASLVSGTGSTRNLYNTALDSFYAAMTAVGTDARVGGILWLQGESDVLSSGSFMTANYHSNSVTILDGFRDAIDSRYSLGLNATKLVIGQIGQSVNNGAAVRAEQALIATEIGAGFASSTGLVMQADNLHFTAAGAQGMGERMATAIQTIPEPTTCGLAMASALAVATVGRRRPSSKALESDQS